MNAKQLALSAIATGLALVAIDVALAAPSAPATYETEVHLAGRDGIYAEFRDHEGRLWKTEYEGWMGTSSETAFTLEMASQGTVEPWDDEILSVDYR